MGVDWASLTDEQLDAVDELWNSAAVKEGDAQAVASTMADLREPLAATLRLQKVAGSV